MVDEGGHGRGDGVFFVCETLEDCNRNITKHKWVTWGYVGVFYVIGEWGWWMKVEVGEAMVGFRCKTLEDCNRKKTKHKWVTWGYAWLFFVVCE